MPVKSQGRQRKPEGTGYIYGNTVRKQEKRIQKTYKRKKKISPQKEISCLGDLIFMITALIISSCILIGYLYIQNAYTMQVKHIEQLKERLNILTQYNKDELSRINQSINMEEIKKVALEELGMEPVRNGQILYYENTETDYVKQLSDIPKE